MVVERTLHFHNEAGHALCGALVEPESYATQTRRVALLVHGLYQARAPTPPRRRAPPPIAAANVVLASSWYGHGIRAPSEAGVCQSMREALPRSLPL